jgi:hypothetical protein
MKKGLLVISFVILVINVFGQNVQVVSMQKYLANSIYSFTRLVNWPAEDRTGDFIITVIGNSSVYQELNTLVSGKTVGAQPIKVRFMKTIDELSDYSHIVFLGGNMGIPIKKLIQKTNGHKNLLITECEGMIQWGSGINFIEDKGFMKFEINKTGMVDRGLQISAMLEKMAVSVN